MTIDSVVQKTGLSLAVVIITALATWIMTPSIENGAISAGLGAAVMLGSWVPSRCRWSTRSSG